MIGCMLPARECFPLLCSQLYGALLFLFFFNGTSASAFFILTAVTPPTVGCNRARGKTCQPRCTILCRTGTKRAEQVKKRLMYTKAITTSRNLQWKDGMQDNSTESSKADTGQLNTLRQTRKGAKKRQLSMELVPEYLLTD